MVIPQKYSDKFLTPINLFCSVPAYFIFPLFKFRVRLSFYGQSLPLSRIFHGQLAARRVENKRTLPVSLFPGFRSSPYGSPVEVLSQSEWDLIGSLVMMHTFNFFCGCARLLIQVKSSILFCF